MSRDRRGRAVWVALATAALAGCPVAVQAPEELDFSCDSGGQCSAGFDCVAGRCFPSHLDAGLGDDGALGDAAPSDREAVDRTATDAERDAAPADVSADRAQLDASDAGDASDAAVPDLGTADTATPDVEGADGAPPDLGVSDQALPDLAAPDLGSGDMTGVGPLNPDNLELDPRYPDVYLWFDVPRQQEPVNCTVRRRSDDAYPAHNQDGDHIGDVSGVGPRSVVDTSAIPDQRYHYAVFCSNPMGWNDLAIEGENAAIATALPPWWSAGWDWLRRRRLVINNAGRTEDLVDFPLLVNLNPVRINYNRTEPNGADLRFVDSTGTLLKHEVEVWNRGGESFVWVKAELIAAMTATDYIYMYYDNVGVVAGDEPAGVWDNGYTAVYHLGSDLDDSSGGDHDGSAAPAETPRQVAGKCGSAREFDGSNDVVVLADESAFDYTDALTITMWVEVASFDSLWDALVAKGDSTWEVARYNDQPHLAFGTTRSSDQSPIYLEGSVDVTVGGWVFFAAVLGSGEKHIYFNGDHDNYEEFSQALKLTNDAVWLGGNSQRTGRLFNGTLDEVRLAGVARSGAWIDAQHASMTDALVSYAIDDENQ